MSNWFLYLVTVLVWGSTWLAIEFQLGTVAPEVSIFYRYLLASALLFSWCRYRGLKLRFAARPRTTRSSTLRRR
jgi:drug/metabolite transporter (DMT)-like permease